MSGYSPEWLALREPADADARAAELVKPLRDLDGPLVIHDLGCGTGSMGRWLAPQLAHEQFWVLHDHDPALLRLAAASLPDGVTVGTRRTDLAALTAADLAGASLVTASALLDVLTRPAIDGLAAACAGVPVLFTLSVAGRVALTPADPLDADLMAAFNAHQRRDGLLGPDAVDAAATAFTRRGAAVDVRPSPWRLGPDRAALAAEWLRGWVGAAVEQEPGLAEPAAAYLERRLADGFVAEVQHTDLLAR
ncbi:SAM-dependent methyltransferase [Actinomycetes bacterium KLBMP 9797]